MKELLVRLHKGHETRSIGLGDAEKKLQRLWPGYAKGSLTADQLKRRFTLADLTRAARHDPQLHKLLDALGL